MTTFAASVTIVDLPVGTTVTGAELLEAVQTTAGVGQSVQLSLSQLAGLVTAILPTGGATGTILNKLSGANFSTQFSAINTFVNVGTALATSGSATSIVIGIPNGGITSTQIANNAVGTNQLASSIGIASTLSVGTNFTVGGTANVSGTETVTGTATFNGGIVGNGTLGITGNSVLTGTLGVAGNTLITGTFGVVGTSQFTGALNVVGTSVITGLVGLSGTTNITGSLGVVGTALFTSGNFGVVGTTLFTSTFGVVGTSQLTGAFNVVGTSIITGTLSVIGTTNITGALVLGNQATGILTSSGTGVVSAQGGMVLLNTLSPNNVASTNDTSSFTANYKTYMITFEDVCPATQTTVLQMQVATTGSAFISGSYLSQTFYCINSGGPFGEVSTTVLLLTGSRATTSVATTLGYGISGFIKIFNPASTVSRKQIIGQISYLSTGGPTTATIAQCVPNGWYDGATSPITGVNFLFNSGNIQTGTIKIYGIT